jgi:hypothetical protein
MALINDINLKNALQQFKAKLGSPVYVGPMDVKDEHAVEYGYFNMSSNQTAVANNYINFDMTNESKGIIIENGLVTLHKNKTYEIDCSLYAQSVDGYINFSIYDITNNKEISMRMNSVTVTTGAVTSGDNNIQTLYTLTEDCQICIKINSVSVSGIIINKTNSYLIVKEIAQPVVTEYNKEISNPLVTEPLEYGEFGITTDISTAYALNTSVILNKVISGNMSLSNGGVQLKAGKLYEIGISVLMTESSTTLGIDICLCNSATNENIGLLWRGVPATNGTATLSNFSGKLVSPTADISVSFMTIDQKISSLDSARFTFTVKEVRNMPVNQYGGFESKILFDGNANALGTYTLLDSVENYDFLIVEHSVTGGGVNNYMFVSNVISVSRIIYGFTTQFVYNVSMSLYDRRMLYSFDSSTLLKIDSIQKDTNLTSMQINRIIGIKGEIPTLLSGGIF